MRFVYPVLAGIIACLPHAAECEAVVEQHQFDAEMPRLMDIIVNSLYKNREVFFRELLSNGMDALEKARYMSVSNPKFLDSGKDLHVLVEVDEENKVMRITDSGIGMTKADLINNLGTVAKSGTTNFVEKVADSGTADSTLIGQFGVGFYSAFLVADKVQVASKNNEDDKQYVWESTGGSSFTIGEDVDGEAISRGTRITLFFKEDAKEFLSVTKVKELINKFSQFMPFPIKVKVSKQVTEEVPIEEEEKSENESDDSEVEVSEEDEEEKPTTKKITKTVEDWETINSAKPIWMRPRSEISEDDYNEFYKTISKDYREPLAYTHFNAEGQTEFRSILFIPKKASHDIMDNYWKKLHGIKLYVRRVMIDEKWDELVPAYLGFVRGVVDSDDLPLNVNRDQLQHSRVLRVITKKLVKKVLDLIRDMAKESDALRRGEELPGTEESDDEAGEETSRRKREVKEGEKTDWEEFYDNFSTQLKLGCYEDDSNRNRISKLLRFSSWKNDKEKLISLEEYVKNSAEDSKSIYFMSGDNLDVMNNSAVIQAFKKRDIDVLLFNDNLDEPCIQRLSEFDGRKFVSIQKADVKIPETEEEKAQFKKMKKMYKPLTEWWKERINGIESLGSKLEKVTLSKRLVDSPCVVVSSQYGHSALQERIMKAQAFQQKDEFGMFAAKKTLEINANHPIIVDLLERVNKDKEDAQAGDTAVVLFQAAMLEGGYDLPDPAPLVAKMYRLMSNQLGVDPEAPLVEVQVPETSEGEDEKDEEEIDFDSASFDDLDDFDLADEDSSATHGDEL
jgi:heat shock protein 90kDa beta